MKDKIISILKNKKSIDGYRLVLTKIRSGEMFLVRDKMDMNRAKNVLHTSLTVYKDFEEAGKKYRGSADVSLSPTMDEEEINKKIEEAAFAAQFVKNEWYPLSRPSSEKPFSLSFSFDTENLNEELVKIQKAIYKKRDTKAEINSTEIFIDNMEVQIVNSEGVDVRFKKYNGYIEVITDCSIGKEEVEIYGDNSFSTESEKLIDNMVSEQLKETEERALAEKAKHLKSVNVIITNTAAASFFDFYISQASASMVYTKSSAAKLGENFQGSGVKGDKVNIDGINLDNNLITGQYNIKEKKLDLKASLSEKHLEKYYGGKDLGYILYGQIDVKGVAGKIKAIANGRATNFEKNLPDLAYNIEYNADNYSDGIASIKGLDIIDRKYGDILGLTGGVNLKEKTLGIRNKHNKIDLAKLQNILSNPDIGGIVNADFTINGAIDNPKYKLNISSSRVSIKNFKINDILLDLTGDKEKANLNKLNLDVYKNLIVGNGYYDIKNKTYNVIVKSNDKIDVSKFQTFLIPYGIENAKGKISLNIELNEKTEKGHINLEDISLYSSKMKLKLSNFTGPINFGERRIDVGTLKASLNDSPLIIDGFVDLANISKMDKEDLIRTLPYKLHFKMDNFYYAYPEVIKISGSTEITATNEEVYGNLIIKDAIIYDIPNNYYRDFFSLLREQLRKRRTDIVSTKIQDKQSKSDKEKTEEIKRMLNKLMPIDFIVKTERPILIDMDNFNIVVPEVYGKLYVDLNINGKKGKYYIEGETELKDTYFFVGTNEFKVDRGLAVFNENVPLPEINPNIFFESRIEMDDEEYYFSTTGRVNQLRYEISSKTDKVGGDLSALIVNPNADEHIYSYGDGSEIFITFMKNLIAGQVGQIVFGNTTRYIKRKLNLTKFVIRPEVKIYNDDNNNVVNKRDGVRDNRGINPEIYNVNAKLEAKDNIYKDKLFWKANVRIIGTGKEAIKNQTMKVDSKVREYDVGLEYKVDDSKTIEIGVGTVPDKYRIDENKDYRKPNYHIGFKFRKRYRDFSEIFSF